MKYFLFDKVQKYVTRINTEYLIEAHYTEEINTAGQLEFTLPATMRLPKNVFYVCVTDPDDETSYLMFKIVTEKVTDEKVTYTCIENAYDELASYTYIKDKRPTAIASAMLQMVLDGTRWSVGSCPEVSPKFCSFYYISVLEAIQKIVNLWGFEVQFQVKIDGITNEIKQRNINLYTKLGKRTNKRFEYGSNLLSVTQANDSTGLYTALVGRGKGVQVSNGDTDTDPDGYGRRITFADVVWSTQSGNPLNKPAGQEYLEDPNATAAYGFPDGHPRIGFVTFQDCEDPNELIQLTYDKLQEINHPQVQFSASIADVGSLDLGDTIAIVRHDIGIEYYTRVFKVVHDLLDSSNNTVELGDNIAGSNSITQQISNIQNNQSNVQNAIDTIVMNGSDGNKLFFGTDFPANGTDGDIFYKTLENGGTEMYIYKDGGWQLVVSTEELDAVQKKVDEQISQIQQAVQDANAASAKADGLVAQVGDANTNAQKALTTAQQNQADLTQAKNQLSNIQSDLTSEKSTLSSAVSDISQTKQRLSDLATQAQTQGQTIVNIQKTQSGLTADIADVKGNVSSLQDTAEEMQSSIADNKNNIANIKATAQGLQVSVEDNKKNISTIQQQAGTIESAISTVNSDNLIYNSDFLTTQPGISPLTNWKPADGWNSINTAVQRCMWFGYSALQVGRINANAGMYTRAIKASQPNTSDASAKTQYNLSFLIKTSAGTYDVYIDCSYDDTFNNSTAVKVDTITQAYSPWTKLNWTVELPSIYPWIRLRIISEQDKGLFYLAQPMLVYGSDTPGKYISSNQPGQKMSSIKQTIDSIQSTVQGNAGQISQVKQTATSLQSTITKQIGTYLSNGDFADTDISKYWVPWASNNFDEVSVLPTCVPTMPINYMRIHCNANEEKTSIGTKDFIPVNINENLEIKAWSWLGAEKTGPAFQMIVHCFDSNNQEVNCLNGYFKYDKLNEWEKTDVTWGTDVLGNSNIVSIKIELVVFSNGVDASGCVSGLEVVNGTSGIASQFTQSIDSITSKIEDADGDISQLKQTSDSLTSQIGNANNDISSLKQRADSMESNISDNKNDISDLKQTASSLQSNIQSKTDISQFTQLSNAFQTVVQNIGPFYPDGDFSDTDLSKYYDPWDTCTSLDNFSVVTDNSDWGYYLQICTPQGTINKMITKEYLPINANYPITFKGKSLLSYDGELKGKFQVYYHFYDSNKNQVGSLYVDWYKYDNNNVWQDFSSTLTPPSGAVYLRIETVLDNSEGTGTYWGALDNLSIENGEATIASKISQMSDDINLRVQKGDLLSQINIQAGSTLIQSNKLFLDASSVVFSGNAFIPSAAIKDLSADKITTGTLNAANVHVINMDVANLVGDKASFVRSQWQNAYGAYVNIDGGGMSVGYGNWFTKFDGNGMAFKDGGDDLGGFTRIGMDGAPGWYGGLAFNAGGDAEFLSIGAKDYHNDSQNPIPAKLIWMRQDINTYGYNPGWNFGDDVWTDKIGINSIQHGNWNIYFGIVVGSNNFSALTLTSGSGDGFYWGSDGSFGYVTGGNTLHNVKGSQIVYSIDPDGTCHSWGGV